MMSLPRPINFDDERPGLESNDFVVLSHSSPHGDMEDAPTEFDHIQFSIDSATENLNLEQAVQRVRDLVQENLELKVTLQANNADMNEQYERITCWKDKMMESSNTWNKRGQEAKELVAYLRDENTALKMKMKNLEKSNNSSEVPDLMLHIMELQTSNELLKNSKQAADREIVLLKGQSLPKSDTASQVKVQTADKEVLMPSLNLDGAVAPPQTEVLSLSSDLELVDWKEEVEEMQKQIESMRSKEIEKFSKHATILSELNELRKQVDTYKQMECDFINAQQEKEAKTRADQVCIDDLTEELSESKTKLNDSMGRINELTGELQALNTKLKENLEENDKNKEQLVVVTDLVKNLELSKAELKEDVEQLHTKKVDAEKKVVELGAKSTALNNEISRLQNLIGLLTEEKHELSAMNNQLCAEAVRDRYETSLQYLINSDDLLSHVDEIKQSKDEEARKVVAQLDTKVQTSCDSGSIEEKLRRGEAVKQMQQDRDQVGKLSKELKHQVELISDLKQQLVSKDCLIGEKAEKIHELEQRYQTTRYETKQEVDVLTHQLRQLKVKESELAPAELVKKLEEKHKNQAKQYAQLQRQHELTLKNVETQKRRFCDVEQQCDVYAKELQGERAKTGRLLDAVGKLENHLSQKDIQFASCKAQLEDVSRHFNQLLEDHHEMLESCEHYKMKCSELSTQAGATRDMVDKEKAYLREQFDASRVQVLALKDGVNIKESELKDMRASVTHLKQTIDVLQQQLELYKTDFNQEREARQRAHADLEIMKDECDRLQRQVEECSQANIAGMQQHEDYNLVPGPGQIQYPGNPYNPYLQNQVLHPQLPVARGYQNPGAEAGQQAKSDQYKCPCCDMVCPDVDTLQIHCMECLDKMENNVQ